METRLAFAFAAIYGTGNGLMTITRGTMPLVLFDARQYGTLVGRLLAPSFYLSAAGPVAYAYIIQRFGPVAALDVSLALSAAAPLPATLKPLASNAMPDLTICFQVPEAALPAGRSAKIVVLPFDT